MSTKDADPELPVWVFKLKTGEEVMAMFEKVVTLQENSTLREFKAYQVKYPRVLQQNTYTLVKWLKMVKSDSVVHLPFDSVLFYVTEESADDVLVEVYKKFDNTTKYRPEIY